MKSFSAQRIKKGERILNPLLGKNHSVIFDSLQTLFSIEIFLKQILIHLFVPLFNWTTSAHAQCLSVLTVSGFLNLLVQLLVYLMIASYYCSKSSQTHFSSNGAIWVPLITFLIHRIAIGLKYGCLSTSEYKKLMETTDKGLVAKFAQQLNMKSGWLARNEDILEFEIVSSAMKIGINPHKLFFTIPSPTLSADCVDQFYNWKSFLAGDLVDEDFQCPDMVRLSVSFSPLCDAQNTPTFIHM